MACVMTFGDLPDASEFGGCPKPTGKILMAARRKSSQSWTRGPQYSPAHNRLLHSRLIPTSGAVGLVSGEHPGRGMVFKTPPGLEWKEPGAFGAGKQRAVLRLCIYFPGTFGRRGLGSVRGQDRSGLSQHKEELSGKNRRLGGDLRTESSYKQATGTVSVTGSPSQSKQASLVWNFPEPSIQSCV